MDSVVFLLLALMSAGTLLQVQGSATVTALYGETITVPCNGGITASDDLLFVKWKYDKADSPGDLLIKHTDKDQATVPTTDYYAQRISIDDKFSLLISNATLKDQRIFTCMVVSTSNVMEYPVYITVHKKPSSVEVMDKPDVLQKDKTTTLGTCVAADSNPPAIISWTKNGKHLDADGKAILITSSVKVDPATGLSTTTSTLQYTATKLDMDANFSCVSSHDGSPEEIKLNPFPIHYPCEGVRLQIMPEGTIVEGDNVTLKCKADCNPPPSASHFHIKNQKGLVENSDTYTLTAINREASGEYKCSLADSEHSDVITVNYLDLKLNPTGKVVKSVDETLTVEVEHSSLDTPAIIWTKNGIIVDEPSFAKLTYTDAGVYKCAASIPGVRREQSFELVVEGKPVITSLTKHRAGDAQFKVLTCEAEGVPEPIFQWSVNGTTEASTYINGKATHKITVVPKVNLTVTCSVSNKLGDDVMTINVSSVFKEVPEKRGSPEDSGDQAKLIVGVVAGLLIAAAVVGLIYWLYMKNSRQGTWNTGEKEVGTSEESKKLEENNHTV